MKENAATRVLDLLLAAREKPDNRETWTVWAEVLGEDVGNPGAVARAVGLVAGEIESIREALGQTTLSGDLYNVVLNQAAEALGTRNLSAHWKQFKGSIDQATINGLGWCAAYLPGEDTAASADQLKSLDRLLREFEKELASTELDDWVRAFLLRQMAIIRQALAEYRVVGAKAFDAAVTNLTVDLADSVEIVEQLPDSKVRKLYRGILSKAAGLSRFAGGFVKVQQMLEGLGIDLLPPGNGPS